MTEPINYISAQPLEHMRVVRYNDESELCSECGHVKNVARNEAENEQDAVEYSPQSQNAANNLINSTSVDVNTLVQKLVEAFVSAITAIFPQLQSALAQALGSVTGQAANISQNNTEKASIESQLASITSQRQELANRLATDLYGADLQNDPLAKQIIAEDKALQAKQIELQSQLSAINTGAANQSTLVSQTVSLERELASIADQRAQLAWQTSNITTEDPLYKQLLAKDSTLAAKQIQTEFQINRNELAIQGVTLSSKEQSQLTSFEKQVSSLSSEKSNLESELMNISSQRQDLAGQMAKLAGKNNAQIAKIQAQDQALELQQTRLETQYKSVSSQLNTAKSNYKNMINSKSNKSNDNTVLNSQKQELYNQEISKYQELANDMKIQIANIKMERQDLAWQMANADFNNDPIVAKIQAQDQALELQQTRLETQLKIYQKNIESYQNGLNSL